MKPPCGYCGHPEADHCKGKTAHGHFRDVQRQLKQPRMSTCAGRHCTNTLCCCICFLIPCGRCGKGIWQPGATPAPKETFCSCQAIPEAA